jgi:plastocyanin
VRAAAFAAAALAIASCGSDGPQTSPQAKATIVLGEDAYRPSHVRVMAGERITFVNAGLSLNTAETGNAPSFVYDRDALHRRGRFDTHVLDAGEAETIRLDRPGTYEFHSSLDRAMVGTVEVVMR